MQHVYIIGSKSIGQYGGFETFVKKLLETENDGGIQYHVACKSNGEGHMDVSKLPGAVIDGEGTFTYSGAECKLINVNTRFGPAQAIFYDIDALKWCCNDIKTNNIEHPIVYILASRIGPFEKKYVKKIHKLGGKIFQNPDGHEDWRKKWNWAIRKYWKYSERLMVKNADLVVCDSVNIEKYINKEYEKYSPKTTFIAYGSDITPSQLKDDDPKYVGWLNEHGLRDKEFYLSVGRFVPENNFETMIREFMKSASKKDFAIITTSNEKFLAELDEQLHFRKDSRIKFVGTVYDQELLSKIRANAFGYFHGHEVGGTNPSLLEALGTTKLNLLFRVGFNREVAGNAALYWDKAIGNLCTLIDYCDEMSEADREKFSDRAKKRVKEAYNWPLIADMYKKIFLTNGGNGQ